MSISRARTYARLCFAEQGAVYYEMQQHPKTEVVHQLLKEHFSHLSYVTVSSERNALYIAAPSLNDLLFTSMKVKAILRAHGLEEHVTLC